MKRIIGLFAAATAAWLLVGSAIAQEKLLLTGLAPAGGPHSKFYNEWAARVNAASNGTLAIEVRDGATLANFGNVYERTMDDVVQIGWMQLALVAGKFPLSTVTDLPFMSDGYQGCSVTAWRLYESGLVDGEFSSVVPLWFGCLGQNGIHLNKPLASKESLGGLKIRVASKLASEAIQGAGGTSISMTVENVYESLQRGTLDGAVTSWPAFGPQKLAEVTTQHLEVPVGATVSAFFMSKKRFDALPEDAKKALMENSGEAQSRAMGEFIAGQANINREKVAADPAHTLIELSEVESKLWEERLLPLRQNWVAQNPGGDKVIEFFEKTHAEVSGQ